MARLARGLLAGLLGTSLSAQGVPEPPSMAERAARADVILQGTVSDWKRTSWFWKSEKTYVGRVRVEQRYKGTEPRAEVEVELRVTPGAVGGGLSVLPEPGRFVFFLVKGEGGRYTLAPPPVYGLQAMSPDEVAWLEAALKPGTGAGDAGTP
jgi:hypothetical protein